MPVFRKKAIEIEAMQCINLIALAREGKDKLPDWFREGFDRGDVAIAVDHIGLQTLEGIMIAQLDDMIICGVRGELYPCKLEIFKATYEHVSG